MNRSITDWLITTIAAIEEMDNEEGDLMKVTITPGGDIVFDGDNIGDAVEFTNKLREQSAENGPIQNNRPRERQNGLTPALAEVYEELREYPTDSHGVSTTRLAEEFGIRKSTMDARLRALVKRGVVEKIGRGVWRAVR